MYVYMYIVVNPIVTLSLGDGLLLDLPHYQYIILID